jgi:hypothetical protein
MVTPAENDKDNKSSDLPAKAAKISEKDREQLELFDPIIREMMAVERERIDSVNRRTEIAREAIQMSDVADKRQFDYRMEDLRTRDESDRRRHALASRILWGGGIVSTLLLLGFLGMAFFAPPDKAALALDFLKVIFTGLGGGGVLTLIIHIVRWMLRV